VICDYVHAYGGEGVYVTVTNMICVWQYYKAETGTCDSVRIAVTQTPGFDPWTIQHVVSHYTTTNYLFRVSL
jgi:hypothetical protein